MRNYLDISERGAILVHFVTFQNIIRIPKRTRLECVGLPNMMKYPSLRAKNDLEAFRPTQAEPKAIKRPPFLRERVQSVLKCESKNSEP